MNKKFASHADLQEKTVKYYMSAVFQKLNVRNRVEAAMKARDEGYIETWNSRQAYIALGFLLETAALLEIDAS